jgi:hypothetical protein
MVDSCFASWKEECMEEKYKQDPVSDSEYTVG